MSIKFTDNSEEVKNLMEKAIARGLEAVGITAEKYAKKDTPVDTGRLRNSISHATKDHSEYIGTNVEYAPMIELGAKGRPAHHMLRNAAADHGAEYKELIEESIKNA